MQVSKMMRRLSLEETARCVTVDQDIPRDLPMETRFTISPDSQDSADLDLVEGEEDNEDIEVTHSDTGNNNEEQVGRFSEDTMENVSLASLRNPSPLDIDTPVSSPVPEAATLQEKSNEDGNTKSDFVNVARDVSRMLDDIDELLGENTMDISKLPCIQCESCKNKGRKIEELESKVERLMLELREKESIVRDILSEIKEKNNEIQRLNEESKEGRKLKEDHLKISEKVKKLSDTAKNKTLDLKARNQDILKLRQAVADEEKISQERKNNNEKLRKIVIDKELEIRS